MKFGVKAKEDTGGSNSGRRFIKGFKDGTTIVQFLEEMGDWTAYYEHYDPSLGERGLMFPCTGNRTTCPGCTSSQERVAKASKRYLTNALVGKYVDLVKVPVSLIDRLAARADRDGGTILAREYEIMKSGKGTDTDYDVERGERTSIDVEDYRDKMQDHQQALADAYIEAFGALPEEESEAEAPQVKPARRAPVRRAPVEDKPEPKPEPKAAPTAAEVYPDDPPSEPQQDAAAAEGESADEVELSEDELRRMAPSQLKALFAQCGLDAPDTEDSNKLADALIAALTVA